MPSLDGSAAEVPLGSDVVISAPGLVGDVVLQETPRLGTRDGEPPRSTEAFDDALRAAEMIQAHVVEITAMPIPGAEVTLRSPDGRAGIALDVPDLGPERGQVLLLTDEQGVLSWHYPVGESGGQAARGGGGSVRFVVPGEIVSGIPPGDVPASERSLVTAIGRKLLSVLVYPIATHLIGKGAQFIAKAYEDRRRPHLVRTFTVSERNEPGAGELDEPGWRRLGEGRALLFVHGTFSSTIGGFGALPDATLEALTTAYDGRVFAFDHPTMSVTPADNAREFLARMPADLRLDIDIVSHSRGGLVARALAGELFPTPQVHVERSVFVATPNSGTALADPKHMGAFVDRYTSLLNLLPPGPWSAVLDVMESILELVKLLGQGVLVGLPGLQSMDPSAEFLSELNTSGVGAAVHYAIEADFEPTGSLVNLVRLPDLVADRVFGSEKNDMVVPTLGVGTAAGDPGFPVTDVRRLHYDAARAIWHCSYFGEGDTGEHLVSWLPG